MNIYSLLLALSGLSQREAADAIHKVRRDTVKSWSAGRNPAPSGAVDELRTLIEAQERAAGEMLQKIEASRGADAMIKIGYPADDQEAQSLGFPTVSAWAVMAARVVARSPVAVRLVPRGAAVSTAVAVDAREKVSRT